MGRSQYTSPTTITEAGYGGDSLAQEELACQVFQFVLLESVYVVHEGEEEVADALLILAAVVAAAADVLSHLFEQQIGCDICVVVCLCIIFHKDSAVFDLRNDLGNACREASNQFCDQRSHLLEGCAVHFEIIRLVFAAGCAVLFIQIQEDVSVVGKIIGVKELCGDELVDTESGEAVLAHSYLGHQIVGVDYVVDVVIKLAAGLFDGLGVVVRALGSLEGVGVQVVTGEGYVV